MNRRHGVEGVMGIGGGMVSSTSRKNLERAEDLCRKKKPKLAVPYLLKAIQDDNNLDAFIQAAFLLHMEGALEALEAVELRGRVILKRELGHDCFDDDGDCVGRFWMILPTRPYMRVLQSLVKVYHDSGRFEDSAKTIMEMLRLCPNDNMGQRFWLGSLLIRCGRHADALYFAQQWLSDEVRKDGKTLARGGCTFRAPQNVFPESASDEMSLRWASGQLLYTAALASFKVFGDIPISRTYLKMAVTCNPHVLLKILAQVKKPPNLNNDPRTMNGPEEAQDYLWLTQDLWMENDIWAWANNNSDAKDKLLKTCSQGTCGKREVRVAEYKRCSACHIVSYCSAACQKEDWSRHKPVCIAHKKQKETLRAFNR